MTILKEDTANEGYAISFENAVKMVNNLLPSKEDINSVLRKTVSTFPIPAIREAIQWRIRFGQHTFIHVLNLQKGML